MKKILFILMLATVTLNAVAQGRYSKSYEDFKAGSWHDLPSLKAIHHSVSHQLWSGGNDYKFTTDDKETDKLLKKEAFIIEYQDTLYVNLRSLRYQKTGFGNGYTKGTVYDGDKIMFVSYRIGKSVRNKQAAFGALGGMIGGAISASAMLKDRVCYLIDDDGNGKTTEIKLMDDNFMKGLLFADPALMNRYMSIENQKERESAANILPLLQEKGVVAN